MWVLGVLKPSLVCLQTDSTDNSEGRILRLPPERGCVEDQPQQLEQTWCWNSPSSLCCLRAATGLIDTAAFRIKSPLGSVKIRPN